MRILLVDDDEALMASLANRLIHQRYAVDIAIDGGSAKTYVDLFNYDLIVLDLILPDGNGIEFCRQFRRAKYANPLMILTAKGSTPEKVKALDAGADDYVVKPFDFDEVCARIRALLRREHQGLPAVLDWGPLTLDPSTCETSYGANAIHLTPKEFSLLELFLRHPHQIYSLGKIIEDLWSFEDPPGEDAVRTHMKGLRRKLKAAGAPKDLIQTVYGQGYRLKEGTQDWVGQAGQAARVQAEMAQAFNVYLQAARRQVDSLEQTVSALCNGNLPLEQHRLGQMNAHKLAGSLGSFGLSAESEMAQEIEAQLLARLPSGQPLPERIVLLSPQVLAQRVQRLNQRVETAATQVVTEAIPLACAPAVPLLVAVSDDAEFSQWLVEAARAKCCQLQALSYQQAKDFSVHPDLWLLDLEGISNSDELMAHLDSAGSLPVVVLSDDLSLSRRLSLVHQGLERALPRNTGPERIVDEAIALLKAKTSQIRVAIADDDTQMLAQLQKNLEPWGFTTHTFARAAALWDWLVAAPQTNSSVANGSVTNDLAADVLILDIAMPEMSGIELCRVLRADTRFQSLPILFLTAHQDDDLRAQAFEAGADDVIHKTVALTELATRLRNQFTPS